MSMEGSCSSTVKRGWELHIRNAWHAFSNPVPSMPRPPDSMWSLVKKARLLPAPAGPLPPAPPRTDAAPVDDSDTQVPPAFVAAGIKPLSARDAFLCAKAIDNDRKAAIKKWASLVASDFNAWGVAKQALGPYHPQFATGGLIESISDCLADRATSTLHQRAGPLARYVHFWKARDVVCLPIREGQMYDYMKAVPNSAPTYFRSLLISVSFARHLLGLVVLELTLDSGRIKGLANAHYSARCAVKRRPALTVVQVIFLEGVVWNDAKKIADRIAAGCFLLMIYGRLRFSDMQRTSKLVIDSVRLDDGSEAGYLEGQAERTKTSISLERKVRALPIAVPLKSVSGKPWARRWMELRDSEGLDDSFPMLPSPASGGGWTKVPLKVGTAGAWLRSLIPPTQQQAQEVKVASRSCKCTVLSWLSKHGESASVRRTLGYHVPRKDKSLIIYSRDALAAPLRVLDAVLDKISKGEFRPDATRSGMVARELGVLGAAASQRPSQDPLPEVEAEAVSSSSSEGSDDEEEASLTEEEEAINEVAGPWGPNAEAGPCARHKQTRYLHLVRDEAGTHLKCGRAISTRFEILANVPTFMYPACSVCFP